MYKIFKVESGRFEVYEEDAQGNTVQVLSPDYATQEEAAAKANELNEVPGSEKVQDIVPPADDSSKSGDEGGASGPESPEPVNEATPGGESASSEAAPGSEGGEPAPGSEGAPAPGGE